MKLHSRVMELTDLDPDLYELKYDGGKTSKLIFEYISNRRVNAVFSPFLDEIEKGKGTIKFRGRTSRWLESKLFEYIKSEEDFEKIGKNILVQYEEWTHCYGEAENIVANENWLKYSEQNYEEKQVVARLIRIWGFGGGPSRPVDELVQEMEKEKGEIFYIFTIPSGLNVMGDSYRSTSWKQWECVYGNDR